MTHAAVPDILARIVSHKEVELQNAAVTREFLERRAQECTPARRDFAAALHATRPAIIAEVKRASPSKGLLTGDYQPARTAALYQSGGAAAISVLTDTRFFQGSLDHLHAARNATSLPVLRKDFTISEYHVVEAAAHGADAILLIAAILDSADMRRFRELAETFRMTALVEVHDAEDLTRALDSGAKVIGVNNRDLRTFAVSLETSMDLAARIPPDILKISESGIESREQIGLLQSAGYNGFLIGEHLMRAAKPDEALRVLTA